MIVQIPGLLVSYTGGSRCVEVAMGPGDRLGDVLRALDARYPGFRFRIIDEQAQVRPHIKLFVDGLLQRDLNVPVAGAHDLMIVGALSGG